MSASPAILEPLSTGDIIDRSVRIYRKNLRPLLGTVALPFVLGSVGGLLMRFGQNTFALENSTAREQVQAVALLVAGFAIWVGYVYLTVLTVAGLSRTVGDYIMLGEPITVRASIRAVRRRLRPLTGAFFVFVAAAMVTGAAVLMAFFVVMMVSSAAGLFLSYLNFPPVFAAVLLALGMLVSFAVALFVVAPLVLARVVFVPQAIMIEGSNVTVAVARALALGGRNWNRVLGIVLFSLFVCYSLAAAVVAPGALLLWLTGNLSFDEATFSAIWGGIVQFASCLLIPVWSIAYTLLYFDNRVRKEAYDVDLLARHAASGSSASGRSRLRRADCGAGLRPPKVRRRRALLAVRTLQPLR